MYESKKQCGDDVDEFVSFTFDIMCDTTPVDKNATEFVPATFISSDFSGCKKQVVYSHSAGCPTFSMPWIVNFCND